MLRTRNRGGVWGGFFFSGRAKFIVERNAHTKMCPLCRSTLNRAGANEPSRSLLHGKEPEVTGKRLAGVKASAIIADF
jgi:hypothetical protein